MSKKERERLDNILSIINSQEASVVSSFNKILIEHNCDNLVEDIFLLIRNIFNVSFGFELTELNHKLSNYNSDIKGKFREIEIFLERHEVNNNETSEIIRKLIDASCRNEYFSKVSSSTLYAGLFQNNKLDRYLGKKELFICLDTQILLRFICVKYKRINDYTDKSYNAVKDLIECISSNDRKINAFTTIDYLSECVSHLWTATRLDRFSKLDYITKLGPSKNVFYNFYLHLCNTKTEQYEGLYGFVEDMLGHDVSSLNFHQFDSLVTNKLASMLELVGLTVKSHGQYQEFYSIKKEYEYALAKNDFSRTRYAIDNDIRTAILLGQEDRFINSRRVYSEPFLITWDSSFQYLRDAVYRNTELSSWFLYTPYKFIDRVYIMEFKVDPNNINMNIASLIEEDFSTSSKFSSFFDVISSYFEKPDISELSIAKKLVGLKDRTFGVGKSEDMTDEREVYSPLTDILIETRTHYRKNDSKYNFYDVISIFEDPEFEQQILSELMKALKNNRTSIISFTDALDSLIDLKKGV